MNKILFFWQRIAAKERRLTLSTIITLIRIILAPVLVLLLKNGLWTLAFLSFICAVFTDLLDGWLARAMDQQTFLGACLDPIADKILLVSCFTALAWIRTPFFSVPHWFAWIIVGKELVLVVGTIFLYTYTGSLCIAPTWLGKTTTCVQLCFIGWLFACYFFSWAPLKTYWIALFVVMLMVGTSLLQYSYIGMRAWKQYTKKAT
jgi:cardiolipin synthase